MFIGMWWCIMILNKIFEILEYEHVFIKINIVSTYVYVCIENMEGYTLTCYHVISESNFFVI